MKPSQHRTMDTVKRTAPVLYRSETINKDARTVDFVMATDAPADFGGYFEILGMDDGEIRTKRLDAGIIPVLDSHPQKQWKVQTIDDQFGIVIKWSKENGIMVGTLKFAKDERSDRAFQKILDDVLKTGSVGYYVYKVLDVTPPEAKKKTYRAVDWELLEFSLVSIPADPDAQTRSQSMEGLETIKTIIIEPENIHERNSSMKNENQPAATTPPTPAPTEGVTQEERARIQSAERERINDIRVAVRSATLEESVADDLIARGLNMSDASKEIFKLMREKAAKQTQPDSPTQILADINTPAEEKKRESRIKAMAGAILFRADPENKLPDESREFAGLRFLDLARRSLALQGKNVGLMSEEQVIRSVFQTTSDFPIITGTAMNMSVKRGWDTVLNNYENLVTHTNRGDFKEGGSVSLSDAPKLQKMNEHGEFETGKFSESAEKYKIETFGVEVGLTRETIYNDQFGVFGKVPFSLGASGSRNVKELVWNIIIANAAMNDGVGLFHATHKNLTAATASLNETALAALILKLRKSESPKKKIMNYNPGYLIVSAELEEAGRKLLAQIYPAMSSNANVFKDTIQGLIVEGTLGAKDFYLSGRKEEVDMIELAWLNGNRGVQILQKENADGFLGIKWDVWMDVGGAPLDYRGLQKGSIT